MKNLCWKFKKVKLFINHLNFVIYGVHSLASKWKTIETHVSRGIKKNFNVSENFIFLLIRKLSNDASFYHCNFHFILFTHLNFHKNFQQYFIKFNSWNLVKLNRSADEFELLHEIKKKKTRKIFKSIKPLFDC